MSSPEDIIGLIADFVQWVAPSQPVPLPNRRAAMAAFDPTPVTSNIIVPFSRWEYVGRSPTLAAPFNIKEFIQKCLKLTDNHAQIYILLSTLALIVFVSTCFVAFFAKMVTPNSFRHSSAWWGMKISPLNVLFLALSMTGHLPIIQFFPKLAAAVHHDPIEQSGKYQGAMAQVFITLVTYEAFELGFCLLVTLPHLVHHILHPKLMGIRWTSLSAWIVRLSMFGLQLWFTRVSVDTTTSPVQIGTYFWTVSVWNPQIVWWTEKRVQTTSELKEDFKIVMQVFLAFYFVSSALVWLLVPKGEVDVEKRPEPEPEPELESESTVSDVCADHPTDGPCFNVECPRNKESMESWVPKSFVQADEEYLAIVQRTFDKDMDEIKILMEETTERTRKVTADINREMKLWRKRQLKTREMDEALREFRNNQFIDSKDLNTIRTSLDGEHTAVDRLRVKFDKEESARTKRVAECISQTEQKYSEVANQYSDAWDKFVALKKSATAFLEALKELEAKKLEAKKLEASVQVPDPTLVSRGTENVSANTLESRVSKGKMRGVTRDTATSSRYGTTGSKSAREDRRQEPIEAPTTSATPATREIGRDVWSRVKEFTFRPDQEVTWAGIETRTHLNGQDRNAIRKWITDFIARTHDNDARIRARQLLKDLGPGFKFSAKTAYLSTFLDLAEMNKSFSDSRTFTELGPHELAYACGLSPKDLGIDSKVQCDWGTYLDEVLPRAMKNRLKELSDYWGWERDPRYSEFFKAVLKRYFGTRPELRTRRVIYHKPLKPSFEWDYNLIARRLLENFGLLKFSERPWESPLVVATPFHSKFLDSLISYDPGRAASTSKLAAASWNKGIKKTNSNGDGAMTSDSEDSRQSNTGLDDSTLDSNETTSSLATPVAQPKAVDSRLPSTADSLQDVIPVPVQSESPVPTSTDDTLKALGTQIAPATPPKVETVALPPPITPKSDQMVESTSTTETKEVAVPNTKPESESTVSPNTVVPSPRLPKSTLPAVTLPAKGNAVSVPWANHRPTSVANRASTVSVVSQLADSKKASPTEAVPVSTDSKEAPRSDKKDRMAFLSTLGNVSSKPTSLMPDSPPIAVSSLPLTLKPVEHVGFSINKGEVNLPVNAAVVATDCETTKANVKPTPSNDNAKVSTPTSVFKTPTAFNASQAWPTNVTSSFSTFSTTFAVPEATSAKTGTNFKFDLSTQFDFSPTTVRKPPSIVARGPDPFTNIPIAQPVQPAQTVQATIPPAPPTQPIAPTQSSQPIQPNLSTFQSSQSVQHVQPFHTIPSTLNKVSDPSTQITQPIIPVQSTNPFSLAPPIPLNDALPLAPNVQIVPPALPYPIRPVQPLQAVELAGHNQSAPAVVAIPPTKPALLTPARPDWRKEALANSAKTNAMTTPIPGGQSTSLSVTPQMSVRQGAVNPLMIPPTLIPTANASTAANPEKPDWRRESMEDLAKKASFAADPSWTSPSSASPNKPRQSKRKPHGESRRNPV